MVVAMTETTETTETRPAQSIKIGERFRKDMGDLDGLARSINENGLLNPITIQPGGLLIAGERRLRAWQKSKYATQDIPVRVVDLKDVLRGEYDENAHRKDFTPSEAVAIMRALLPMAKAEAKERSWRSETKIPCANFAQGQKGKSREKVAALIGVSHGSLSHASMVVAAAEAEPKKYGHLVEEMDRTGKITTVYRKLSALQGRRTETITKAPTARPTMALHPDFCKEPSGLYTAIVVDGRTTDLAARLRPFIPPQAVIWIWVDSDLPATHRLLSEFGFVVQRMLVWEGNTKRASDVCLIAMRGEYQLFKSGPLLHLNGPSGRWKRPIEFICG